LHRPTIYLQPVRTADNTPSSSAFVRLFYPYANNTKLTTYWNFTIAKNSRLPEPGEADIAIIQRDAAGIDIEAISDWLIKWRAAGNKCVLELDDDLFDAEELHKRTHSGKWTVTQIVKSVKWLATAADAVITSTPYLQKLASQYNKNVFLIPNFLDANLWSLNGFQSITNRQSKKKNDKLIKIGYFGTATHNDDLAIISETMKRLESEYGNHIKIEIIGAFQKKLDKPFFGQAIPLSKATMYPHFVKWLQSCVDWDIAIIPLEDNHFNKSKSYLKYLESTAMGLVCVCSSAKITNFYEFIIFLLRLSICD